MDIEIGDGRGRHKTEVSEQNRKSIIDFFKKNPGSTQKECADYLGLSIVTVWKHLKSIK